MGYYITVVDNNLKFGKDISAELKKFFEKGKLNLPWKWEDGYVAFDENFFKWTNEFLKDLLVLRDLGIRGHITTYGEEGEYYKYEIDDKNVKEYYGSVKFPKKPEKTLRSKRDMKEFKI